MKLDQKLTRLRKKNGLSQIELAEKMQVSRQAISRWETGDAVPSTDNLGCLSRLYGVSVDYLLDDSADEPETGVTPGTTAMPLDEKPENEGHRKKAMIRWAIFSVLALLALSVIVYIGVSSSEKGEGVHLDEMTGEEVEVHTGSGFEIDGW